MKLLGRVVLWMSVGVMGACFINEDALQQEQPSVDEPVPPIVKDEGPPGRGDGGVDPRADTRPPADPSCPIDFLENDDSPAQLPDNRLFMHVYRNGPLEVTGLTACLEDEDWIPAYSDCCLSDPSGAVVRWDASVGPLEVDLVDSKGVVLPPSGPHDINERRPGEARLLRAKHRGGGFLVRIRASGAVSVPYSVELYAPVLVD
ncbi:MAG: hypothetical protein ABW123_07655 [Cystobacter sp.]